MILPSSKSRLWVKILSALCMLFLLLVLLMLTTIRFYDAQIREFSQHQSITAYAKKNFGIDIKVGSFLYQRKLHHWQINTSDFVLKSSYFDLSMKDFRLSLFLFENFLDEASSVSTLYANEVKLSLKKTPSSTTPAPISQSGLSVVEKQWRKFKNYLTNLPYTKSIFLLFFDRKRMSLIPSEKFFKITLNNIGIVMEEQTAFDIRKVVYDNTHHSQQMIEVEIQKISHYHTRYQEIVLSFKNNPNQSENWHIVGQIASITNTAIPKQINYPTEIYFQGNIRLTPTHHQVASAQADLRGKMRNREKYSASSDIKFIVGINTVLKLSLLDLQMNDQPLGNLDGLINFSKHKAELTIQDFKLGVLSLTIPSITSELSIKKVNARVKNLFLAYDYATGELVHFNLDIPNANIHFNTSHLSDIRHIALSYRQSGEDKSLKIKIPKIEISLNEQAKTSTFNLSDIILDVDLVGDLSSLSAIRINPSSLHLNEALLHIDGIYYIQTARKNNLKLQLRSSNTSVKDIQPIVQHIPNEYDLSWLKNLVSGHTQALEITIEDNIGIKQKKSTRNNSPNSNRKVSVLVRSDKIRFYPYEGWPMIEAHQASALYKDDQLLVQAEKVIDKLSKLEVNNPLVLINFDDLSGHISIEGEVKSSNTSAIDFIQSSPIPQLSGWEKFWHKLHVKGELNGPISIMIPIVSNTAVPVNLNFDLKINNALIDYDGYNIHRAQGNLIVQDNLIYTSTFTGLIAGRMPAQFRMHQPDNAIGRVDYIVKVPKVENYVNFATGHATFSGQMSYRYDTFKPIVFSIHSPLKNASLNLLSLFKKKRGEKKPFYTRIKRTKNTIKFDIAFAENRLSATYDQKKNRLEPFVLTIGKSQHKRHSLKKGAYIFIDTPYINVNQWAALLNKRKNLNRSSLSLKMPSIPWPQLFFKSEVIVMNNSTFNHSTMTINLAPNNAFKMRIATDDKIDVDIQGQENNYLDIAVNKLNLSWGSTHSVHQTVHQTTPQKKQQEKSTTSCYTPNYHHHHVLFPKITLRGKNIRLNHSSPATFIANGSLKEQALLFNQFRFNHPEVSILIKDFSYKYREKKSATTRFNVNIKANTITPLMGLFGLKYPDYLAEDIDASGDFYWQGAPWCVAKNNLQAKIKSKTGIGVIKSVEPGIGRLFSLLNLKILFERFQDNEKIRQRKDELEQQGLNFDKTKLEAEINNQIVEIKQLRIDSPIAVIKLKGKADDILNKYDFVANVKPEVVPTLVTLTAIFGGPLSGVITLFSSELLSLLNLDDYLLSYDLTLKGDINNIEVRRKNNAPK